MVHAPRLQNFFITARLSISTYDGNLILLTIRIRDSFGFKKVKQTCYNIVTIHHSEGDNYELADII